MSTTTADNVHSEPMIVGLALPHSQADTSQHLHSARQDGFDYVTTALPVSTAARPDVAALDYKWWSTSVVGTAAAVATVTANTSKSSNQLSESFKAQLQWAWHMGLPAVIMPPLTSIRSPAVTASMDNNTGTTCSFAEYAQSINAHVLSSADHRCQVWIPVLLDADQVQLFQQLQATLQYPAGLHVMVVLKAAAAADNTTTVVNTAVAARTSHELQLLHTLIGSAMISCVAIPTTIFLTNKRGFPTLSKHHQFLLQAGIMQRIGGTVRWLLQGPSVHPLQQETLEQRGATGCLPYLQYLQHVRSRPVVCHQLDTAEARLEREYLDHLQRPLQPLKDHLENSTYETFEKDPVKYERYQHAISMALQDRRTAAAITIAVVGAGRGPLVTCAIQAWQQLPANERPAVLHVFAVEKNPSAVIYLQSLAAYNELWKAAGVKVVQADLRYITRDHLGGLQADIVVSELLGSFGCNELSPECLDSLFATSVCGNNTISIPVRYTSHLAPVSSVKLHTQARQRGLFPDDKLGTDSVMGYQRCMETAYVVRPHAASQMAPEQDCWEFVHPPSTPDKNRSAEIDFAPDPSVGVAYGNGYGAVDTALVSTNPAAATEPVSWTLTGFVGTFTADLYFRQSTGEMCRYATAPSHFSVGMFSWFPLYFPLNQPLLVPAGASVKANVWRRVDESKVWYEWSACVHRQGEVLALTAIHNPDGRSSNVSL